MRSFWDIFKKLDPHVAKKDHAEMMLACAICDDKEPFENFFTMQFKSPKHGSFTITIQRDEKKSVVEVLTELRNEIDKLTKERNYWKNRSIELDGKYQNWIE